MCTSLSRCLSGLNELCGQHYSDTNPNTALKSLPTFKVTRDPAYFLKVFNFPCTVSPSPPHTHAQTHTFPPDFRHLFTQCALTFSTASGSLGNVGLTLSHHSPKWRRKLNYRCVDLSHTDPTLLM